MKLKDAIRDTNYHLVKFLKHDNWEVKLGFKLIRQGLCDVFNGLYYLSRWTVALITVPFIPVLYPIAVLMRVLRK